MPYPYLLSGCGGRAESTLPGGCSMAKGELIALGTIPTRIREQLYRLCSVAQGMQPYLLPPLLVTCFSPDQARPLNLFYCSRLEYPDLGGIYHPNPSTKGEAPLQAVSLLGTLSNLVLRFNALRPQRHYRTRGKRVSTPSNTITYAVNVEEDITFNLVWYAAVII